MVQIISLIGALSGIAFFALIAYASCGFAFASATDKDDDVGTRIGKTIGFGYLSIMLAATAIALASQVFGLF